jgi:hypothetical protein
MKSIGVNIMSILKQIQQLGAGATRYFTMRDNEMFRAEIISWTSDSVKVKKFSSGSIVSIDVELRLSEIKNIT